MSIAGEERRGAEGRRAVKWTPWLAGLAAVIALVVLGWAAFGGRGGSDGQAGISVGPRRAATVGAVEAVALTPALDPGPAGAPGGPGSAVLDAPVLATGAPTGGARSAVTRTRRRPRPQPRPDSAPSQPSYRAIGPGAESAPAPSAPPPAPSGA